MARPTAQTAGGNRGAGLVAVAGDAPPIGVAAAGAVAAAGGAAACVMVTVCG